MSTMTSLVESIQQLPAGLTLVELMMQHPQLARRTAQRWISRLIDEGKIIAHGEGRARRYFSVISTATSTATYAADEGTFPGHIGLSVDSRDILAYVDQPLEARKPVGYQRDFLETYVPNRTWYLSESLRR